MALPSNYSQVGILGSGYFADVIECEQVFTHDRVALKRLKRAHSQNHDYVSRFNREIKIAGLLRDVGGVLDVIESGVVDGLPFYASPVATSNLHQYIAQLNASLSVRERCDVLRSVLVPLCEAHRRRILHRDISPHNVLIFRASDDSIDIKIADFGLGKSDTELTALTKSAAENYGAVLYVAPEQREQLVSASTRSDVFSLGRLLQFVMTGRSPDSPTPHGLSPVVRKATADDPDERYADAASMLEAFDRQCALLFGGREGELLSLHDLEGWDDGESRWAEAHSVLVNGQYDGRTYYGFLQPVVAFFDEPGRLERYVENVEEAFDAFALRLAKEIEACAGQTGWPFARARDFYPLLYRCIDVCADTVVKVECFGVLWRHAYESDQWAAQDLVKRWLTRTRMDAALQAEVAAAIAEGAGRYVDDSAHDAAPPGPVRRAIGSVLKRRQTPS